MKKQYLILIFSVLFSNISFSQDITSDTILANSYCDLAKNYTDNWEMDSASFYILQAQNIYIKHLGENSLQNSITLYLLGNIYYYSNNYEKALDFFQKSLDIRLKLLGENNIYIVSSYMDIGLVYKDIDELDIALEYYQKALKICSQILEENNSYMSSIYNNMGSVYENKGLYNLAIVYYVKSLNIRIENFGKKSVQVATCYNNIGSVYTSLGEYDKAIKYYNASLNNCLENLDEKNPKIASLYNNFGNVYESKGEYDKSLNYYFKALKLRIEIMGESNVEVATTYNNIGYVFKDKGEFDKALEYFEKALNIRIKIYGEKHSDIAGSYTNIGTIYLSKHDFNTALEYFEKSLEINLDILGEISPEVAIDYNNIGYSYQCLNLNQKALEYYIKDLKISYKIYETYNPQLAISYNNIGCVFNLLGRYDESLEYYQKALKIKLNSYNEKHPEIAGTYNNIALVYCNKKEYQKALETYQKAIYSNSTDFVDTINLSITPGLKNYMDYDDLLTSLYGKAKIFADTTKNLPYFKNLSCLDKLEIALNHFQTCDSLITDVRKEISTQSDKIALGERASDIYKRAVDLMINDKWLVINEKSTEENINHSSLNINHLSFHFSERNKSSVLLEALAGSNALKFAGIPTELLEEEQILSTEIANCKTLKNNAANDSILNIHSNCLFNLNRTYDSLIVIFETNYPAYFQLKYNNSPIKVEQIQQILDKKTAMLSYFVLDNSIVIYLITKDDLSIYKTILIDNFPEEVNNLCEAIQSNKKTSVFLYKDLAFKFYNLLFPDEMLKNKSFKKIENLIIIPDGALATIPFEALLTENYTKEWTTWEDTDYFSEMPFAIKKYNISYSYSATLFYNTFPKENNVNIQISNVKDWIAFAPVFDDNETLNDGSYINPLPGTLTEVQNIFKIFKKSGLNAETKTHKQANEEFVKSGKLHNYRYLHFATHGFVNTIKPELSGIVLSQDTSLIFDGNEDVFGNIAEQNDGFLYQSEIYNLELNADLVVLSACETGLGKIISGEGVIGLTRALLYAGTKNIIVSLWSVSDESTTQLMINFYDNLLNQKPIKVSKNLNRFGKDLQIAKLQLIEKGTYAHPFYWSPFILIGK